MAYEKSNKGKEMHERVCVEAALALFEGKRVVHVKGFESGLDFADAETAAAAKLLLSRLEEFDIVVWEGSDLERDSYTAVLEHAPAALVAFKYKDDKLDEKWSRVSACVEVEDRSERLCVAALSTTRARCVLCLGGDDGVAQDASMCPPQVNFHLYECGRWTIPEHVLERPALARGLGRGAIITTESAFQSIDEAATSTRYFLASNNRLVIKRSILLPTAGLGLFTAVPLLRGQRVCDYVGDELTTIEAMRYTHFMTPSFVTTPARFQTRRQVLFNAPWSAVLC